MTVTKTRTAKIKHLIREANGEHVTLETLMTKTTSTAEQVIRTINQLRFRDPLKQISIVSSGKVWHWTDVSNARAVRDSMRRELPDKKVTSSEVSRSELAWIAQNKDITPLEGDISNLKLVKNETSKVIKEPTEQDLSSFKLIRVSSDGSLVIEDVEGSLYKATRLK